MGQDVSGIIEQLDKDMITICSNCKKKYNLNNRTPIMVCSNQHNYCEQCLEEITKSKKCYQCKETLLVKKKKNSLLCYIIDKLNISEEQSQKQFQKTGRMINSKTDAKLKKNEPAQFMQLKTIDSPERRSIKINSLKQQQQSIPNLNLQRYNQQVQFRKKYSVASIFSVTKQLSPSTSPRKNVQQTFQDILGKIAEQYQIPTFRNIAVQKTDPLTIKNLDLHLHKIPKVFEQLSQFKNLLRLNLTKNRISKIQNLSLLTQLNYLSLSQNQIQTIQNLQQLKELKNLYLNRNRIQKIEKLNSLTKIQFLGLSFNAIRKIENIDHLSNLKWLNLECNYIQKIEGMMTLKRLQIILLGSNEIVLFEGFQEFPALQEIHIQNNKINNLSKALSMKHLRKIKLEDNPGLKEDNSDQYLKLLEVIQAKSKGIQKIDQKCIIY